MKKITTFILASAMALSLVACGKNADVDTTTTTTTESLTTTPAANEAVIVAPDFAEDSIGSVLWNAFLEEMKQNEDISPLDMANILASNEAIDFSCISSEAAPGYLAGFNEEITGFKAGATFGPMISPSTFLGYIFELDENADVNAFITTLTNQSNPGWNICVVAGHTAIGSYNNMVFFLMF